MQYVTLVNRTEETLAGTWDGRHYDIGPGKHSFPEITAMKFREQNPVMGTEDPRSGKMVYKLGIVEHNDPIDPLGSIQPAIERWDRSKLVGAQPSEVVPGDNGLYQMGRTAGSAPLSSLGNGFGTGSSFVDPSS